MSRRHIIAGTLITLGLLPLVAGAQTVVTVINYGLDILEMLSYVLMSAGIAVFFWGIVKYMMHADDERAKEEGKNIMIWGMVGLFVMIAFWGIVGYLQESLGLDAAGSPSSMGQYIPTTLP